jgi:muramoyltetrapeptide carboxypeptidase LdcA involved in peptidoglycan recycling
MRSKIRPTIAICVTSLGASKKQFDSIANSIKNLQDRFEVVYDEQIIADNQFDSRSVEARIKSINWAAEKGDIVMAWNGGYNAIELIFAFDKLRMNSDKIFVGYSDNTILVNALAAKQVCRAWQGPTLARFLKNPEYGGLYTQCLLDLYQSDYAAVSKQYNKFGMTVLRSGEMCGPIFGGNNYTFDLLQGTEFCPDFTKPYILLLEGENFIVDKSRVWQDFVRNLDSIMLQPCAIDNLQGLLIGRFPEDYQLNRKEVELSLQSRNYLSQIPIIYDFARSYNANMLYLPIGEPLSITASSNNTVAITKLNQV